MSRKILVLNGPNLNLLGTREPETYGSQTLDELLAEITRHGEKQQVEITGFQSNSEGDLIDALHEARTWAAGVVFNAGAYTHTSVALGDAITAAQLPVVEVHMSNVAARETFRHTSYIAPVCLGTITGFGATGYLLAVDALVRNVIDAAK